MLDEIRGTYQSELITFMEIEIMNSGERQFWSQIVQNVLWPTGPTCLLYFVECVIDIIILVEFSD